MSDKEIVDRLKMEGDLIRNKGKHSVKAVLLKMDKFQDLFVSIDRSLMEQTAILRSNLSMNSEEIERLRREANFRQNSQQNTESVEPKSRPIPEVDGAATDKSFFGGIAALIGGAFSGVGLSAFRGVIGKSVISAFGLFLAPAIGNWVSDFIEQSLKNLNFDEITASVAGDALGNATTMGILGSIISKRMGLLFAGGGFVASFADDIANALGFTEEQMQKDLILGLSGQDISQGVMFAIGTTLSGILMKKSVWSGLFSMSGTAASAILSKTGLGILARTTIPMAVAGLYLTYGEEAKRFLDNYVPEDIANITVDTLGMAATGASIGAMFGPGGMIAGAAIGFALGLGKTIFDWLGDRQKKAEEEYRKKLDSISNEEVVDYYMGNPYTTNRLADNILNDRLETVTPTVTSSSALQTELATNPDKAVFDLREKQRNFWENEESGTLEPGQATNLMNEFVDYQRVIGELKTKVEKNPEKFPEGTPERNALNSILSSGIDDDIRFFIEDLANLGATLKLPVKPAPKNSVMSGLALDQIILEPPSSLSAVQTAMNAGIAEKSAQLNMVQMGAPQIVNNGGNSNMTNNSSITVVTGSENKLFGIGFAQ